MVATMLLAYWATAAAAAATAAPPTCGQLKVGEAFPASRAMEGSMDGSFDGTAARCC